MCKFMELAIEEARIAEAEGEVPVGAVIVKNGEVIAKAHNLVESNQDPTAHAELLTMKQALARENTKNLMGCSLYVTLEPCSMCIGAAHLCKISRVYFGAYDPKSGACGGRIDVAQSGCFDYKTEIYGSILEPACEKLLTDFFQEIRKDGKNCGRV